LQYGKWIDTEIEERIGSMAKKIGFGLLWLGFTVYAFLLAPPDRPDTAVLIQKLITGQWDEINPLIVTLFNIMGIWPGIYACVLFADGRGQKVRAFPFVIASIAVGAFGLLPYFALRSTNPTFTGEKNLFIKFWDSRITGVLLTVTALVLLSYGVRTGDFAANLTDFVQQWQTDRFIHVMSLDFCLLSLLFPWVLGDDMSRRGLEEINVFSAISLFPLIAPLIYLCLRPPMIESDLETSIEQQPISS